MQPVQYTSATLTPLGTEAALWWLLVLPLAGALACVGLAPVLGRRAGGRVVAATAVGAMAATFVAALALVVGQLLPLSDDQRLLRATLWPLFQVGGLRVTLGLVLDPLAAVMVLLVGALGTLIHIYAAFYMRDDPAKPRFFAFLNLFVFSMLLLVLADGFVPLLFGWEGVGVCSYFLIGFWHHRPAAADAAMKAFVVNRIGDAAFVVGIGLLLWGLSSIGTRPGEVGTLQVVPVPAAASGAPAAAAPSSPEVKRRAPARALPVGPTLSFSEMRDQFGVEIALPRAAAQPSAAPARFFPARSLLARVKLGGLPLSFVVCLLIFLGAAGKSAQLPFFAWLPDAMAGPTPVSALIHAATMVTAGVYLLARLSFLFALSPAALTVVAVAGTLTALVGAAASLVQYDLKRVLAYSTVSQLGYMFAAAAGGGSAGIFHVVTHGFFKACLFLAAGVIIHAVEARLRAGVAWSSDGSLGDTLQEPPGRAGHGRPDPRDPQDLRHMGDLAAELPWIRRAYFIACLALAGFPVASGFFSKEQIFAGLATAGPLAVPPSLLLGALALVTFLTSWYAFRSYYLVFSARVPRAHAPRPAPVGAAEIAEAEGSERRTGHRASTTASRTTASRVMEGVVVLLALGAILVGPWLGWPSNWTPHHDAPLLARFLAPAFAGNAGLDARPEPAALEWGLQAGSLVLAALGLVVARGLYRHEADRGASRDRRFAKAPEGVRSFLMQGWRWDDAMRILVVSPVLGAARAAAWLDRRIFDRAVDGVATAGIGAARLLAAFDRQVVDGAVAGVSDGVIAAGGRAARWQNGRINSYVLGIAAGVAALVVLVYVLAS